MSGSASNESYWRFREPSVFERFFGLAQLLQCSGHPAEQPATNQTWRMNMTTTNNLFAAAFSVVITASLFAYAIIPASPTAFV